MGEWLQIKSDLPQVNSIILETIGGFNITNTFMAGIAVTLILAAIAIIFNIKYKDPNQVPGKLQTFLEMIYEAFFGYFRQMSRSKSAAFKLMPVIGTIFFFVYFSNVLTSIPPFSFLTYEVDGSEVSMFRAHTSDFNTTFAVAGALILITHFVGIWNKGLLNYLNGFFPLIGVVKDFIASPKKGIGSLLNYPIQQFIGILDIIGELAKSFSISLRLFGNIFAGEVLTVVFFGLLAPFVPALWWMMGLFTAAIQTLVYGSLISNSFLNFMEVEVDQE